MNRALAKSHTLEAFERIRFRQHQENLRIEVPRFMVKKVIFGAQSEPGVGVVITKMLDIRFRLFRNGYLLVLKRDYALGAATPLAYRGENWLRSRDLRDGKPWKLPLILWDIFCYEFKLGRFRK